MPGEERAFGGAIGLRRSPRCPDLAREMGRRGHEKVVPEFGVDRMIEKLENLYRELLQEKGILTPCLSPT